jgi:carbamoyl-phosphate synthase small subunit
MLDIDHIIDRVGGPEAAARLTNVGAEAVRKWRQAGLIPSRHWPAIIAATGLTMADLSPSAPQTPDTPPPGATAVLVLADGTLFWGRGFGAHTDGAGGRPGEVCFNTGMTGHQETMTDPSYAAQIIVFTFPHVGNVGANNQDLEAGGIAALGLVTQQDITQPSNWRALQPFADWIAAQGIPGIANIDTRALTIRIRDGGAPNGLICFPADGRFNLAALHGPREDRLAHADRELARNRIRLPRRPRRAGRADPPRRRRRLRRQAQHPALPGQRRLPRHGGAG